MPEHHAHETPANGAEPVNETVAFEARDVSVSGVERVGLGLAIVVLIVLAVAAGMFHFLTREQPLGTPEIAAGMRAGEHPLRLLFGIGHFNERDIERLATADHADSVSAIVQNQHFAAIPRNRRSQDAFHAHTAAALHQRASE